MKCIDKIKEVLAGIEGDVAKVDAGQKAAGVRVRAALMEIRQLCIDGKKDSLSK